MSGEQMNDKTMANRTVTGGNNPGKRRLRRLYIVIPCYNEEDVLPVTAPLFRGKLLQMIRDGLIDRDSKVLFVNDGSKDRTWEVISNLSKSDSIFLGIKLSRNRGHQNALMAGLMEAKDCADITISIDCDGQDDINVMDEMICQYLAGCEVVYGVRSSRLNCTPCQGHFLKV